MSNGNDDNDFAEFIAQTGGIKKLKNDKVNIRPQPPKPKRLKQRIDSMAALLDDQPATPEDWLADAFLNYRRDGITEASFKKLKRGQYRIDISIDLHGMSEREARQELSSFLHHCSDQGHRIAHIIHGRSIREIGKGPILKTMLDFWLRGRREVLAFSSAQPRDGGPGAAYVLLKRQHQ